MKQTKNKSFSSPHLSQDLLQLHLPGQAPSAKTSGLAFGRVGLTGRSLWVGLVKDGALVVKNCFFVCFFVDVLEYVWWLLLFFFNHYFVVVIFFRAFVGGCLISFKFI